MYTNLAIDNSRGEYDYTKSIGSSSDEYDYTPDYTTELYTKKELIKRARMSRRMGKLTMF